MSISLRNDPVTHDLKAFEPAFGVFQRPRAIPEPRSGKPLVAHPLNHVRR